MIRQPATARITAVITCTILLANSGISHADPLVVTNDFVTGQPATAASVNQNFSDAESAVTDNDARITTNASDIGDNFSAINSNFNALETRLIPLEAGLNGVDVPVDCSVATGSPDALLTTTLVPGNTYVIDGFCDGPIYIFEPAGRYRFRGANADRTQDGIVSPVGQTEYYVVGAFGPVSVRLDDLTISGANYTSQSDGVWVGSVYAENNAAVSIYNSNIVGGDGGVFADNASAYIGPGVSVTGFGQTGLGSINNGFVSSTSSDTVTVTGADGLNGGTDAYREGMSAWRGGVILIRGGGTFTGGTDDGSNTGFGSYAANAGETGALKVNNNGIVTMTGEIEAGRNGSLRIETGILNGNVSVFHGGHGYLRNMTINGNIEASYTSTIQVQNATINGAVDGYSSSTIIVRDSDQSGGMVWSSQASLVRFDNASTVDATGFGIGAQYGGGLDFRDSTTVTSDSPINLSLNATLSVSDTVNLNDIGINCQSQASQIAIGGSVTNVGSLVQCPL